MTDSTETQGESASGPEAGAPTTFQILCGSLAAQVHMALGLIPDPVDQQTRVELGAARQGIDMLTMLAEKTMGNLDEQETRTLSLLLTQLRMFFVERVKELKEQGSEAAEPPKSDEDDAEPPKSDDGPTIILP